jgi:hypothetical protein
MRQSGVTHTYPFETSIHLVIPAQAGTQCLSAVSPLTLDPRLRGDDESGMAGG